MTAFSQGRCPKGHNVTVAPVAAVRSPARKADEPNTRTSPLLLPAVPPPVGPVNQPEDSAPGSPELSVTENSGVENHNVEDVRMDASPSPWPSPLHEGGGGSLTADVLESDMSQLSGPLNS